jgi:hypothetical protein
VKLAYRFYRIAALIVGFAVNRPAPGNNDPEVKNGKGKANRNIILFMRAIGGVPFWCLRRTGRASKGIESESGRPDG